MHIFQPQIRQLAAPTCRGAVIIKTGRSGTPSAIRAASSRRNRNQSLHRPRVLSGECRRRGGEDITKVFIVHGRMAMKTCTVTFTGPSGVRHSVEVSADSLYEAAIVGFCMLK